ncbi:hypothetical protein M422DRAFT_784889 [Sphaerobolus stellatus SS14]|uniref:BHLH domain-containing protein n=1 Tax=Sphaerobolus stellatus (strain SS14) TaxID=990650 RepID=A0A0C9U0G6_SPHS4|nr:hypothetical protein M422DRAFT_784889 [Sphaerobolus stellatus SS14]
MAVNQPRVNYIRSDEPEDSAVPGPAPGPPSPPSPLCSRPQNPLLFTPPKRLDQILSEQKRRNVIRDGYATLTTMLAPAGAPIGSGIPTRGRAKGSGRQGNGGAKGKSGVLFMAVEYCRWVEEGVAALRVEILVGVEKREFKSV